MVLTRAAHPHAGVRPSSRFPFPKVIRPGLDRVRRALDVLDHPEESFASVLVAGTNGKGSVSALVEAGLRRAGHRTGLYTSPHLVSVREPGNGARSSRVICPSFTVALTLARIFRCG